MMTDMNDYQWAVILPETDDDDEDLKIMPAASEAHASMAADAMHTDYYKRYED